MRGADLRCGWLLLREVWLDGKCCFEFRAGYYYYYYYASLFGYLLDTTCMSHQFQLYFAAFNARDSIRVGDVTDWTKYILSWALHQDDSSL
jgi:hypothetical protein